MKRKDPPDSWQAPVGKQSRFRPGFVPRKMCSFFESTGYCQKGDSCTFAHNADELEGSVTKPELEDDAGSVVDTSAATWDYSHYKESNVYVQQEAPANSANGQSRFRPGFVPRKMCSFMEGRGFCNKGDACTFAHSDEELKNGVAYSEVAETPKEKAADVNIKAEAAPGSPFETANFKRKMCSFFAQGQCNRGDACTFAHSAEELQGNPSHGTNVSLEEQWPEVQVDSNLLGPREFENNFKPSLLCKLWMRHPTLCRDGDACTFAHGLLELKGELEEHVGKLRAAGFFGSRAMPSEHAHSAVALCPGTGTYPMESKGSWPRNGKGGKGKDQKGQGPVSPVSHSDGNADVAAVASMAPSKYTPEDKQAMVNFIVRKFSSLQPMKLCKHWLQSPESCFKGDSCTFAHGLPELNPQALSMNEGVSRFLHTGFTPKVPCKFMENSGQCYKGILCTYAHSEAEMK